MRSHSSLRRRRASVVVFGAGNIGSHALELLARLPSVVAITIVDPDTYEVSNLTGQSISPRCVGRPKADVQARRLKAMRPDLEVRAIRARLEDVPLGLLRADLMLGCLDSKLARMGANEAAWRLKVPLVDAGVNADGFLVRASVYQPGQNQPCLECAWDERDYATLEHRRPCAPGAGAVPASGAPACLGSLAASLQVIQCAHFCGPLPERFAAGRQIVLDAASRKFYDTELRRNPHCRFDHQIWRIQQLDTSPDCLTLSKALALGEGHRPGKGKPALRFDGKTFVRNLVCGCGYRRTVLRIAGRLREKQSTCPNCGARLLPAGLGALTHLGKEGLSEHALHQPLSDLGFMAGDVFSINRARRSTHWEFRVSKQPLSGHYVQGK